MINSDYAFCYIPFKQRMKFLLSAFKRTKDHSPRAAVDKLLKKLEVSSSDALPEYYCQALIDPTSKQLKPRQIFKELLHCIPRMVSASSLVKLFTIIFALLRKYCYPEYFVCQLQAVEELKCSKTLFECSQGWIKELYICCITYLGRIYSLYDVFYRALLYKNLLISDQTMQTDLFRLVNAYRLLFPNLNKVTNWIGRYFKQQHQFYQEFYRTMRAEIILGYNYIKHICKRFMDCYQKIDIEIIGLFNCIISEIEVLGDQIQEFLLNKYYKEKGIGPKLYFKEEDIQQLSFYLSRAKHQDMKYEDMLRTADSQLFAEAKLSLIEDDYHQ